MKTLLAWAFALSLLALPAAAGEVVYIGDNDGGCQQINIYSGGSTTTYWISRAFEQRRAEVWYAATIGGTYNATVTTISAVAEYNKKVDQFGRAYLSHLYGHPMNVVVTGVGVDNFCGKSTVIMNYYMTDPQ